MVVGVSDDEYPLEVLPEFSAHFRIPYPILMLYRSATTERSEAQSPAPSPFHSMELPTTLLIDRAGRLAHIYTVMNYFGQATESIFDQHVRQLLAERY